MYVSAILTILSLSLVCSLQETLYTAMYDPLTSSWAIKEGDGGVAKGYYMQYLNTTGWNTLHLYTEGSYPDPLQAYGAGFLEGYLTRDDIWNNWLITQEITPFNDSISDFFLKQDTWIREMAKSQQDSYWHQVLLVVSQLDGLLAGYNLYSPAERQISYTDMMYMVMSTEIQDILIYLRLLARRAAGERVGDAEVPPRGFPWVGLHCSVLVKTSSDGLNLIVSHDTWAEYTTMIKIYKYYSFNFNDPSTKVKEMAFSSYPCALHSTDDYYVLGNQMVVSETSNAVYNASLYLNYFSEKTVSEWIRLTVANRMADSGESWISVFSRFNSGTYNNQWQIIDYKLFEPGTPIKPGTLWIAEQIPGQVFSADKSDSLANGGYWPSYNIPYFPYNYDISGYPAYYLKYGNSFSYQNCSRALIFRRDAGKVDTIDDMKRLMRSNEYQTDPLSLRDACKTIAARCDLNTPWTEDPEIDYYPYGATDCKIVDASLVKDLKSWIVSGPTWDSQPPFAWTNQWKDIPRYGMPDIYAFNFLLTQPIFYQNQVHDTQ